MRARAWVPTALRKDDEFREYATYQVAVPFLRFQLGGARAAAYLRAAHAAPSGALTEASRADVTLEYLNAVVALMKK